MHLCKVSTNLAEKHHPLSVQSQPAHTGWNQLLGLTKLVPKERNSVGNVCISGEFLRQVLCSAVRCNWVTGVMDTNRLKCLLEDREVAEWGLSVEEAREVEERMEGWISISAPRAELMTSIWGTACWELPRFLPVPQHGPSMGHWLFSQTLSPSLIYYWCPPEPQLCPL